MSLLPQNRLCCSTRAVPLLITFAAGIICTPGLPGYSQAPDGSARAVKVVQRAKQEVRRAVVYDASYRKLAYPGGDVPADRGACTDLVVRSLRSVGSDLQQLIHEDMITSPASYPKRRDTSGTDTNIDHRRVPNQIAFLRRHGKSLPVGTEGPARSTWQPGDLVYWKLSKGGLDHCGVISDRVGQSGLPMVIHNLSQATEEDCLTKWRITAHFRYP